MSTVGQIEKRTQKRIMRLFVDDLGYESLGDRSEATDNKNVDVGQLEHFLFAYQQYDAELARRAIAQFVKVAENTSLSIYDRNREVYKLLRYGVPVKPEAGVNTETLWLIDWDNPEKNRFAIAEEVTVKAKDPKAHSKRPDLVLYVNGIALGVVELKRSTVSVAEGIRQNLDNQKKVFIEHFFSTMQLIMAGNDTEGLRYGTIQTPEKYYLSWKEPNAEPNLLDRALKQLCNKRRFLELIHDFIVFDAGIKKICRHNQYFGVKAAQKHVKDWESGIIWHSQGSGKSLTMVWLAKWIREHSPTARVLVVTDRTELDGQIEADFKGVGESIYRTTSGADLVSTLNESRHRLICSLVHKFGGKEDDAKEVDDYIEELKRALPPGFKAKGDFVVFVDECHRTQSGNLHRAMKSILPEAMFIGFTGTPLLKADKRKSIEVFGGYIHAYKFDEAVRDGVVLDLRYEARDIDQHITSQAKIDQWFDVKTKGLNDVARAQLKKRWGTMNKVLSSQSRLERIADDIMLEMETRDRLKSGRGNAMLVSGSIYQACKFYELFARTDLKNRCAIVTSYRPNAAQLKGEESGEGLTERLQQYEVYQQMLADWFNQPKEQAANRAEEFEEEVKRKFVEEPGQMKLLIVVDKLLTGFDAPPATYLYIDKQMRDHGLFQAICRVNRLDGDDKEYGYIIDYKDLFKSLTGAVHDYTSDAFEGYDKEDVAGLLQDRLGKAKERLEETRETVKALCENVEPPQDTSAYLRYFCAQESGNADQLKDNEPRRLMLYKHVAAFIRAYANLANELPDTGYSTSECAALQSEVDHFEKVRQEVKLASGDYIDLKMFEPAMRHLIDTYIRADDSRMVSAFENTSLVQLIVERGAEAVKSLPQGIQDSEKAVAETIENNVRKLIVNEQPINPKYYEQMSQLLDALVKKRREQAIEYQEYLRQIVKLARQAQNPSLGASYPPATDTPGRRALFDNLEKNEKQAMAVDAAVRANVQDDWRSNRLKVKRVREAIKSVLGGDDAVTDRILEVVTNNHEF